LKIIEPSFELRTYAAPLTPEEGIKLLRWVEWNARISHRSEDKQTDDSWRRFIEAVVVQHGDWSVTEHASVTAILRTDRGITHELVRHRLASYTQESTRFVSAGKKYAEGIEFIVPSKLKDTTAEWYFMDSVNLAEKNYLDMIGEGVRPQEARSVLPNATAATISMTSNLRNWRLFFMSRVTLEAHPDMRRLTIPMLAEFKRCIPVLYDDIESEVKQSISLARAR
jgi:thymidylate synthase (FAD)